MQECFYIVVTITDVYCTDHKSPLLTDLNLLGLKAKKGVNIV